MSGFPAPIWEGFPTTFLIFPGWTIAYVSAAWRSLLVRSQSPALPLCPKLPPQLVHNKPTLYCPTWPLLLQRTNPCNLAGPD
ncbi:unnamed protein product [Pleuronectes platessa]|uniref:Uncharacterized protein n=1 Tax=Pleuronectes platessa TaxID=8262 RepID=A0A9N7YRW6_PLEPL|nr:unnamed protein product [Pleuronectes platessa]